MSDPREMSESHEIQIVRHHTNEDRTTILDALMAYNASKVGTVIRPPLSILIKDSDGVTKGGLLGRFSYDWLFVDMFAVPETLRGSGLGSAIMAQAEQIARDEGCIGIWLDTFEFQAKGFYEKLGFRQFGAIDDHPLGMSRFFMQKRLN